MSDQQPWLFVPDSLASSSDVFGGTRNNPAKPCTPAPLGSGPAGETCGSCAHHQRPEHHDQRYQKCGLMRHAWTHGAGSDIKARWLACREWQPIDQT